MLNKETIEQIKDRVKEINRERSIDTRIEKMISVKDEIRTKVNDQLDELFSTINLKKLKINLDD